MNYELILDMNMLLEHEKGMPLNLFFFVCKEKIKNSFTYLGSDVMIYFNCYGTVIHY